MQKGEMSSIVHAKGGLTTMANSYQKTLVVLDSQLKTGEDIKEKI